MKKPGRRLPIFLALASHPTPPPTRDRHANDCMQHSRHWRAEPRSRVRIYETKVSRVMTGLRGGVHQRTSLPVSIMITVNVMDDAGAVTVPSTSRAVLRT
jgi:hypothetical protein